MFLPRLLAIGLAAVLVLMPLAADAGPYKPDKPKPEKAMKKLIKVSRKGDAYCFDSAIARGNVVIPTGRCYNFYMVRNTGGTFLAFGPPGPPMIPPGQLVRMNTPAGAKVKGRLFYLVPSPVPTTVIPVNSVVYVPVRVTAPKPGRVIIVATPPAPPSGQVGTREIEWGFDQH